MITAVYFKKKEVIESNIAATRALKLVKSPQQVWLDIANPTKKELEAILKVIFPDYYSLIYHDCLEDSKPKIVNYDGCLFIILKTYPEETFRHSQLNIILGDDYVITIREGKTDFSKVFDYFKQAKFKTADFALYKILATVFDQYYGLLEMAELLSENFEVDSLKKPTPKVLAKIIGVKKNLIMVHRVLIHEREIIAHLIRGHCANINSETMVYLKDVYDDVVHLLDTEEIIRDNLSSDIEIHLNAVSNNLNEIMKMLTVVASFVMVPTLIAGIYGMNFKFFPEINQIWGYPFALGLMGLADLLMYLYFKKRGWF